MKETNIKFPLLEVGCEEWLCQRCEGRIQRASQPQIERLPEFLDTPASMLHLLLASTEL